MKGPLLYLKKTTNGTFFAVSYSKLALVIRIEKKNNIHIVHSESSTFASLSFDQEFPKKRPTTAPSSWLERHLTVFCINPISTQDSLVLYLLLSCKFLENIWPNMALARCWTAATKQRGGHRPLVLWKSMFHVHSFRRKINWDMWSC